MNILGMKNVSISEIMTVVLLLFINFGDLAVIQKKAFENVVRSHKTNIVLCSQPTLGLFYKTFVSNYIILSLF